MGDIILNAVGIILTALATWLVTRITVWLNSKVKDTKVNRLLNDALDVVVTAVKVTYQTYVQSLKDAERFDAEAQIQALERAKRQILLTLKDETKAFIEANFGDLEGWIKITIESVLYDLKNR